MLQDRDLAIEALKELEMVEAEKARLADEVMGLRTARSDVEGLKEKVESLSKALEDAKDAEQLAAEQLATKHVLKAVETVENLCKEVATKRESNTALGAHVNLFTKRLEDAGAVGIVVAKLYSEALGQFGGVNSSLPADPSPYNIFSWMKFNFAKLPDFVGGVVDFGALSAATNFSKMLIQSGCSHDGSFMENKDIGSPAELAETSRGVARSVRNFMKSFWVKFGRAAARSMVEAR